MRIPRQLANLYPPFLGAGIRVRSAPDFSEVRSSIKLRWWNRNYVGTHFGGSIYMMTDPFYMVMLIERLGRGHRVWLKEATIRFRQPGRGTIEAVFRLDDDKVEEVRAAAARDGRLDVELAVHVRDADGGLVAEVVQTLSVQARSRDSEQT